MKRYDPRQSPVTEEWLVQPDAARFKLVRRAHRLLKKKKINIDVHAVLHVIVENQIALIDPPETAVAVERMVSEGLDRHDALHAAALIVARHLPNDDDLTADRMDEALNQALASDMAELNRTVYEQLVAEAKEASDRRGLDQTV